MSITDEVADANVNSGNNTLSVSELSEEDMQLIDDKIKIIILVIIISFLIFGVLVNYFCRRYVCKKAKSKNGIERKREIKYRDIILEQ